MSNTAASYAAYYDNPGVVELSDSLKIPNSVSGNHWSTEREDRGVCRKCVSPLNAIAFALLICSGILCTISVFAPFWVYYPRRPGVPELFLLQIEYPFPLASWRGLWAVCYKEPNLAGSPVVVETRTPTRCAWFGQRDNSAWGSIPSWYNASEALFAIGLVLLMLALIVETVFACCHCGLKRAWIPTLVASLTFAAGIMITASLGLFGDSSFQEGELTPEPTGKGGRLDWAFSVGIAGTVGTLVAALLFYGDACRLARRNDGSCR